MEDREKALEEAAFHAWVTLGDLMSNRSAVSPLEIEHVYQELTQALGRYRRVNPC